MTTQKAHQARAKTPLERMQEVEARCKGAALLVTRDGRAGHYLDTVLEKDEVFVILSIPFPPFGTRPVWVHESDLKEAT